MEGSALRSAPSITRSAYASTAAPTGVPWSIWYLLDEDDGTFEGHYVNLELVHRRTIPTTARSAPTNASPTLIAGADTGEFASAVPIFESH